MIFAAGLGTRLKPLTDTMPKAMVPIAGKPLLEHLILKMKLSGIDEIIVNVHHFPNQIIDFLHTNNNFGIRIEVSDEREMLLDTGGGLLKAKHFFDDGQPFLVHNVDIMSNLDLQALMRAHNKHDLATLVVSSRATSRYFLFDENGVLRGWENKLTGEKRPADLNTDMLKELAFSGVHVFSPRIFDVLSDFSGKFSLVEVYLKKCGTESIKAFVPQHYRMLDVGKIDTLSEAQSFVSHLE